MEFKLKVIIKKSCQKANWDTLKSSGITDFSNLDEMIDLEIIQENSAELEVNDDSITLVYTRETYNNDTTLDKLFDYALTNVDDKTSSITLNIKLSKEKVKVRDGKLVVKLKESKILERIRKEKIEYHLNKYEELEEHYDSEIDNDGSISREIENQRLYLEILKYEE